MLTATSNFVLVRFDSTGSVDTTFGNGGATTTDFGNNTGIAHGVVLQSDGRIIAGGEGGNGFALARYLSDGTLDPTFGGGKIITTFGGTMNGQAHAIASDQNGRIVAAGVGIDTSLHFALARYNPTDGSLASFGMGGTVLSSVAGNGLGIALYQDGKILVAGGTSNTVNDIATRMLVARFNVNGSLDFSFGSAGVHQAVPPAIATSALLQADGNIVVAGNTIYDMGATRFAVARLQPDGTPDGTFGTNSGALTGFVEVDLGGMSGVALAVAAEPDGRIIAGGGSLINPQGGVVLVRIWP